MSSQSVSGASVIKAITSGVRSRFTSADPNDVNFSFVSNSLVGTRLHNESSLTAFSDAYYMKTVVISLDAAAGAGALTFNGSGNLNLTGAESGYAELSAAQYSIPAQVPLNTPTLHEWRAPGGNAVVRLNAGGVGGHPEQMRVCWDIEAFGISRASCTRHLRSDGTVVGADSVNRVGGSTFTHETNDDAASPRRVHACVSTSGLYGPGMEPQITETRSFSLFEFFPPRLQRNRTIVRDFVQGPNDPSIAGHLVTDLGNGLTQEQLYNPRSGTTIVRRGNAVESFEYGFGAPGGQQTENEVCSATEGL